MQKIHTLSPTLANQIAAWEVVERPLSVVKELVENSIDAQADEIKIELEEWGTKSIVITDNGEWIEKEDLQVVTDKYSTSKISNLEDLYHIMSFGFRWEAMASIASIAKVEIISKTQNQDIPYKIEVIGGKKWEVQPASFGSGTKITVADLFYNTPARLNYLKTTRTEYAKISSYIQEIALAYPEIGFEFFHNGKMIFQYRKNETAQARLFKIYGEEFAQNTLEVEFHHSWMKVYGYISDPKIHFSNKNRQHIFVNHRPIKSPLISKAISDAYNRFIPHGNYGAYVLHLEIDPTQVDVNVHPRKLEVRFANEQDIFRAFFHAVEEKLTNVSLVKNNSTNTNSYQWTNTKNDFLNTSSGQTGQNQKFYTGSGTKFKSYSPYKDTSSNPEQGKIEQALDFSKTFLNTTNNLDNIQTETPTTDITQTALGKIIWQIHNAYIIVQTPDAMKMFDQHAIAERIIYEKLLKKETLQASQWLLLSEQIQLTPNEKNLLEEHQNIFEEMGFDFELVPGNTVLINAIPEFIKKEKIKDIFLGILEDIGENNTIKSTTIEEVKNKIFASASCRAAIKFGHKLSMFEMNKLLNEAALYYSSTCPHGRPVVYELGLEELKGKYER